MTFLDRAFFLLGQLAEYLPQMRWQLCVQGGGDMTVVAARHGGWYARLFRKPGKETREGTDFARMVVGVHHDNCPVIVDVGGGWGAAAVGASTA